MASHMQEQEVGDGTNFVLVFAGALLELAEELLRMGLSVSEVNRCSHKSSSCPLRCLDCVTIKCECLRYYVFRADGNLPQSKFVFATGD